MEFGILDPSSIKLIGDFFIRFLVYKYIFKANLFISTRLDLAATASSLVLLALSSICWAYTLDFATVDIVMFAPLLGFLIIP